MPHKDPQKRRAYAAAYAAAHREQARARSVAWHAANREKSRASSAAYAAAHREEARIRSGDYYATHREEIRPKKAIYRAAHHDKTRRRDAAYRATHRDTLRAYHASYHLAHRIEHSAHNARRRARKANAPVNDFTAAQWRDLQEHFQHRCAYCGKRAKGHLTQDHLTPLSKGGSHTLGNIAPACRSCNGKKRTGPPPVPVQPLLLTIAPPKKKKH